MKCGSGEDVADLIRGAGERVEVVAAREELFEFGLEGGELVALGLDVRDLVLEESFDVAAGGLSLGADGHDAVDLVECQVGGLRGPDEAEPGQDGLVVRAVPVGTALGRGEEAATLVEADSLGGHSRGIRDLADEHEAESSPLTL